MPNYKSSGEENLRADAQVMSSSDVKSSPSTKGTNAGGESTADSKTMSSSGNKSTPQGGGKTPAGVKTYSED